MHSSSRDRLDAIVVGTGFGGSVTAARLAEAGLRTLVLERGPWWTGRDAGPRARALPRGVPGVAKALRGVNLATGRRSARMVSRRDGLIEAHVFDQVVALTASGVGGGSHLYADVLAEPDDHFFQHLPAELSAEEMRPCFDRVAPSAASVRRPNSATFA